MERQLSPGMLMFKTKTADSECLQTPRRALPERRHPGKVETANGARGSASDGPSPVGRARQADKGPDRTYSPSPRDLPKLQSTPPLSRRTPAICCPIRLSSTVCQGTRVKPGPPSPLTVSSMA